MANVSRNLLDGKKRQASVLGSTLTSLTLISESDSSSEYSDDEESDVESDSSNEEDLDEDADLKSGGELLAKPSDKSLDSTSTGKVTNKKIVNEKDKIKPKVRMKTLTIDGQLVYFCVLCDKIFTRKKDKLNHELAHSNETLLSCPECGKDFFHESSLAHHIRAHDGERLHFCDFCPKMFAQNHQLKAHILTHSNPTEFICKICRIDFKTTLDLSNHNRNKIKDEISALWCSMCKLFCCRIHFVEIDFNKLHAFRCSACNELFHTLKKLKLHANRYAHKFNQPGKITKVLPSEIDETDDCKSDFIKSNSPNFRIKRQIENGGNSERLASKKSRTQDCLNCENNFEKEHSGSDVMPNLKFESEIPKKSCKSQRKPYCKKCNRSFKESCDLISHKLSTHCTTEGLLVCRVCGQDFGSDTDLKQHMCQKKNQESHSSDRSEIKNQKEIESLNNNQLEAFECHICTKTFPLRDSLQHHLRLHTNIRSFQCYVCQKNFVNKHYLQRHLQVHVKEGNVRADKKEIKSRLVIDQHVENCTDITFKKEPDTTYNFKLGLDKENVSCFSGDSSSSYITRESEKTDSGQFSSASSRSFKISMARERRKLRKKRLFSKSPLCKRFTTKKLQYENKQSVEKSVVFVDKLKEGDDTINTFVVEINGAKSEIDQETTLFVELTLAKLVSKDSSALYACKGVDKENKVPSCHKDDYGICTSTNSHEDLYNETHLRDFEEIPPDQILSNKIMVLDFEVPDLGTENFSSFCDVSYCQSETILKSSNLVSNEKSLRQKNEDKSHCGKYSKSIATCFSSVLESPVLCNDEYEIKKDTPLLQPLQSLHLMTSKFNREEESGTDSLNIGVRKACISEMETKGTGSLNFGVNKTCSLEMDVKRTNKGALNTDVIKTCISEIERKGTNTYNLSTGFSETYNSEIKRKELGSIHVKSSRLSSGKTCRDIAASWKSNKSLNINSKNSATVNELVSKSNSNQLKSSNIHCNRSGNIFKTSEKSEYTKLSSESFSSKVKKEIPASVVPLPSTKLPASDTGSSHLSCPGFPNSSQETSLLLSQVKSEKIDEISHENHNPSSLHPSDHSSLITLTNSTSKCSSSIHCTPRSQSNNVFRFDTDNPTLRDMNLVDMVCSIQTASSSNSVTQSSKPYQAGPSSKDTCVKFEIGTGPLTSGSVKSEFTYPPQVDMYSSNNRNLGNFMNPSRTFNYESSFSCMNLNTGMNINPGLENFTGINGLNPSNILRPSFQSDLPAQPSLSSQSFNCLNNTFPMLEVLANNDLGRICSYNIENNIHLGNNPFPCQGPVADFINTNTGHLSLNTIPHGNVANPIPVLSKPRNPGDIFIRHTGPMPIQPSLPLSFSQPITPVFPAGLVPPTASTLLPNAGFVQLPESKMNAGIFYLPF